MADAIGEVFIRVRPETSGFKGALTQQLRGDLKQTSTQTNAMAKASDVGASSLHRLERAAVFASTSLIGGYGLAYGLKAVTKAATDHVALEGQLQNAVQRSGLDYQQYAGQIQKVIQAQEQLGFSEDVSTRAFTLALRATGSITGAQRLLATSANVARGANKDLYASTLVLVRAYDGATTGLKRLGIQVKAGSKGFDALNQVQAKYAGAAVKYADSAAGAQARLSVAIHRTEVSIGTALLPTITHLATEISDWLDKSRNQERIQKDVNEAVRIGGVVFHDFGSVLTALRPPIEGVDKALGGLENTVKVAGAAFAAWKLAGLLGGPSRIAAIGTQAATAEKGVSRLAGGLGRLKAFGTIGITIAVAYEVTQGAQALGRAIRGTALGNALGIAPQEGFTAAQIVAAVRAGQIDAATLEKLRSNGLLGPGAYTAGKAALRAGGNLFGGALSAVFSPNPTGARNLRPEQAGTVIGPSGGAALLGRSSRIQQALDAAARTTKNTADDVKALTAQHVFLQQQIATETQRLNTATTKKQAQKYADNLHALEQQDAGALGQIQSIEDQAAATAKARAARIKAAADKAAREKAAAAKKAAEAIAKAAHADAEVALSGVGKLGVDVAKLQRAYKERQRLAAAAAKAAQTAQETALTIARQAADLALARAETNQTLIGKAETLQEKADRALIAYYTRRAKAAKTVADRQAALQSKISAQIDLAGLQASKASKKDSFTLAQLYQEAESEYKLYGSNYGPGGTPLSPQGARSNFSNIVLKQKGSVHVVQNFFSATRPSQAMNDARAGARYLN